MAIGDPSRSNVDSINNLDVGNPLHVQNSDNSSSMIKFGFVDGSRLKSANATSNVLSTQWDRCNATETYDKVDGSVVYNLLQKINIVIQGGKSVADYYHRLDSLGREFDALTKFPKCTCEVQCTCDASKELSVHQQFMKLMQFLMGLDECYQPVRSALLTRDPLPDVKDAYNTVSREESYRGIPKSSGVSETKMNATSFAAHCNRCYELIGFPPGFKKFASNANNVKHSFNANVDVKNDKQHFGSLSPSGFTPQQMQKLLTLINDSGSGNFHANMAGANQHPTVSTVGMFSVVDVSSLNITVGHPNGTLTTISHIGNLKLTNNVVLYDVIVVPGYCVSLLSMNKLIRDSKMFFLKS
ncbi:hypothetical protein Tco_0014287 [Tanacetum coccineum]